MIDIEELKEWEKRVYESKRGMDKTMFEDLMKIVYRKLGDSDYTGTWRYLNESYIKGKDSMMKGKSLSETISKPSDRN